MIARELFVIVLAATIGALSMTADGVRGDVAPDLEPVPRAEQATIFGAGGGGGRDDTDPEPDPDEFSMSPAIDVASFPGGCTSSAFSYRIEATASTSTNRSVDYIAAKVTLRVGGVVRGDTNHREMTGPISAISDSVSYSAPCSSPFLGISASSWHKAKKGDNSQTRNLSA